MSTSDSNDRRRLIRALEAELEQEPRDASDSDGLERARMSWLDQFRAGARPFQRDQAEEPAVDDLDLWLLLEKEAVFRSGPAAAAPAVRARTPEGAVVEVRRGTGDGTWEVRLRRASPGTYRVDLAWAGGTHRASAQLIIDDKAAETSVSGPSEAPAHVRVTRLAG